MLRIAANFPKNTIELTTDFGKVGSQVLVHIYRLFGDFLKHVHDFFVRFQ